MLKTLERIFLLTKHSNIDLKKRKYYYIVIATILIINLVGVLGFGFIAWFFNQDSKSEVLVHLSSYLNFITFFSGILIIVLSLKNEVIGSQALDFASHTSQARSHEFKSFRAHLDWIKQNVSTNYHDSSVTNLAITVSTPIYGFGVGQEVANSFLDYIESWIDQYKRMKDFPNSPPTVDLAVWNRADNIEIFTNSKNEDEMSGLYKLIDRYAALLSDLRALDKKGYIKLGLYFTDKSDIRIFKAHTIGSEKYSGLFSFFTPLTASSVKHSGWSLTGFSFSEEKGYRDCNKFNRSLITYDHDNGPKNEVKRLDNPKKWLLDHYGVK